MSKPIPLIVAIALMWCPLALVASMVLVPILRGNIPLNVAARVPWFPLIACSLTVVLVVWIIFAVAKGRYWARVAYAIFACIAIAAGFLGRAASRNPTWSGSVFFFGVLLACILALILIFHRASNAWFKSVNSSTP
jgi:hypothetical protein